MGKKSIGPNGREVIVFDAEKRIEEAGASIAAVAYGGIAASAAATAAGAIVGDLTDDDE